MYYEKKNKIKKVFLYLRRSLDENQTRQLRSIPDQEQACLKLAEQLDLEVVDIFVDKASAHRPRNRENFDKMLKELNYKSADRRRADGILAWHPDRLSRNAEEAGKVLQMVEDDKIKDMFFCIYMFHNDSSGKEHLFMEFARAKGYSDKLADNVIRGLKGRWDEGARTSPPPFGYKKMYDQDTPEKSSLFLVPDEVNFPIIEEIFEKRFDGYSQTKIAQHLKEKGLKPRYVIKSKKGIRDYLTHGTIGSYLKKPIYYGLHKVQRKNGEVHEVDLRALQAPDGTEFTPVLTEERFWELQRLIEGGRSTHATKKHLDPLQAKVICSCGKARRPAHRKITKAGGVKENQSGYECHNKACKDKPKRIKRQVIYATVEEALKTFELNEKTYYKYLIGMRKLRKKRTTNRKEERRRLTNLLKSVEDEIAALNESKAAMSRQGDFDDDAKNYHNKKMAKLKLEQKRFRGQLSGVGEQFDQDMKTYENVVELTQNAHQYWYHANDEQKASLAKILLLNLEVKGGDVQSMTWESPFDEWLETPKKSGGRPGGN